VAGDDVEEKEEEEAEEEGEEEDARSRTSSTMSSEEEARTSASNGDPMGVGSFVSATEAAAPEVFERPAAVAAPTVAAPVAPKDEDDAVNLRSKAEVTCANAGSNSCGNAAGEVAMVVIHERYFASWS